jgi:hypothetical protein
MRNFVFGFGCGFAARCSFVAKNGLATSNRGWKLKGDFSRDAASDGW